MAEAFAQPLHRDVKADFGPVAKTIDDRPRRIRDGNVNILDAVTLDAFGQCRPGADESRTGSGSCPWSQWRAPF